MAKRSGHGRSDGESDDVTRTETAEAERRRVRASNDRDQQLEQQGQDASHSRGYDEAADGAPGDTLTTIRPDDAE